VTLYEYFFSLGGEPVLIQVICLDGPD